MKNGICADPPLCRGTSQGKYSSCAKGRVRVGRTGEVGERELLIVDGVRCGKERNMTRG